MSVVYIVTVLFINKLQSTIYFTSLIKSFYYYQPITTLNQDNNLSNGGSSSRSVVKILPNISIQKKETTETLHLDVNGLEDQEKDDNVPQSLMERLKDQILQRRVLSYSLKDALINGLCICRKKSKELKLKADLYKLGLSKIDGELDIRHISSVLRTLKFITNVLLTKHQRKLLPHFKQNLLNFETERIKKPNIAGEEETLNKALGKMISKSKSSK